MRLPRRHGLHRTNKGGILFRSVVHSTAIGMSSVSSARSRDFRQAFSYKPPRQTREQ